MQAILNTHKTNRKCYLRWSGMTISMATMLSLVNDIKQELHWINRYTAQRVLGKSYKHSAPSYLSNDRCTDIPLLGSPFWLLSATNEHSTVEIKIREFDSTNSIKNTLNWTCNVPSNWQCIVWLILSVMAANHSWNVTTASDLPAAEPSVRHYSLIMLIYIRYNTQYQNGLYYL